MTRAVVLGDIDLVRPLAMAGVRSVLFSLPDERARFSRHVDEVLPWIDHWERPEDVIDALLAFARRGPDAPVLYPQTDGDLLALSRHRDRLGDEVRHCLASAELIEDLVDKDRFAQLADRVGLPVPETRRLAAEGAPPDGDLGLAFPVVVKPLVRRADVWRPLAESGKARHVQTPGELRTIWEEAAPAGLDLLVQEALPGPERLIESYHAYVDASGETAAEFTGRKIRTWPVRYGWSTSVETTDAPDVLAAGRDAFARVGLRGVAKADFKRDPSGRLRLLEINPRFTLWHHPAAAAGCNIPGLVHADLTGSRRPSVGAARPGVRWCDPLEDLRAARAEGQSPWRWGAFLARCDTVSGLALRDPAPVLREVVWPPLRRRLTGRR